MLQKRIGIACNRLASGGGMESHVRNLEHSHDDSQTFGHPKSHTLGQPAKGQS